MIENTAYLSSPDGEPIKQFSLYLYLPSVYAQQPVSFGVGQTAGDPKQAGRWQLLSGTLDQPASGLHIYGFIEGPEIRSAHFSIDSVKLTTIPEPSTIALLTLGSLFKFIKAIKA